MNKAVIALSGGVDSATTLANAMTLRRDCHTVFFDYGSKHNTYEVDAATQIAYHYGVPFKVVNLKEAFLLFDSNLLRTGGTVPEGHYEDKSMSQTVVPGRNIIFASWMAGYAWSIGADEVWLGIHAGDHFIYPDCRPQFFMAMREAILHGTDQRVNLQAPYLTRDKGFIINEGLAWGVPYKHTRTCYKDQPVACGKCGSCQERLTAFAANNAADPLPYETRELLPKNQPA